MNTLFGKKKYKTFDTTKTITKYNCVYYGWVMYPIYKNNNKFPFHDKTKLIKLAQKVAEGQTKNKTPGVKANFNIFSRGFTINAKNKEIPYPLLNITNRTLIYPWVSLVLSHTTKLAVIITITRDIDTTIGVGFDVIRLTSKSKDESYNILTQFEQLYCNNNWYSLNDSSFVFTNLYSIKPVTKRLLSSTKLIKLDVESNINDDINDESGYLEVGSLPKN